MPNYRQLLFLVYTTLLLSSLDLIAQSTFEEGVLVYKADTLKRLDFTSAPFYVSQMRIYKKGNLIRQEVIHFNLSNSSDTIRTTQIRNAKGVYLCLEGRSDAESMAILRSYEDERLEREDRVAKGYLKPYAIKKTGQKKQLIGISTERIIIQGVDKTKQIETLVSEGINVPVGLFYEPLREIKGTPLQFVDYDGGWATRYTAVAVEPRKIDAKLFEVDPKFMVVSMKQMLEMGDPNKK